MNTAKELAENALFKGLDGDDIAAFAGIAQEETFEPGQTVYEEGSAGDSLYAVVQGSVVVRIRDEDGDEVDVARLKTGSYFGEMEVLGGGGRTAAIVAKEDSRCYRFDAGELMELLKRNSEIAAHFYRQISRELIRRLRNTTRDMGYFKVRAG